MKAFTIFSLTALAAAVLVSLPIFFAERNKKQNLQHEDGVFLSGAKAAGAWLATSPQPPYPVTEAEWLKTLAPFRTNIILNK